jgi:hypothetical protein
MIRTLQLMSFAAAIGLVSIAQAEDKAATTELPSALQALHVANSDLVTESDAHAVRGEGTLRQIKSFSITNASVTGTLVLLEGVVANLDFTQQASDPANPANTSTLKIDGAVGGLWGEIGVNANGGLSFDLRGKGLQETLSIGGPAGGTGGPPGGTGGPPGGGATFTQNFYQIYQP